MLYLYALIDKDPSRAEALGHGIGRETLSIVRAGGAFVVVDRGPPHDATDSAIRAYEQVVRRLWRLLPAVLPLRFGSTAPSAAELQSWLAPLEAPIERAFERVRGAVQFTARVSGLPAPEPRPDPHRGPGTRWLAGRVARTTVRELACVTEATRPFVRATRIERNDHSPHLATLYQLMAREEVPPWREALDASLAKLPSGIDLVTSGPWPAWSFSELV